jgi:cbb3-type cytochrome oxidase maturation protein
MSIIFIAIPVALLIVAGAMAAFVWAARSGQYDDLATPALRMVHDDDDGDRVFASGRPERGATDGVEGPSRPGAVEQEQGRRPRDA